jgi:hypothetical protein
MPVSGSTVRDNVSVAITCVDFSFQGQYFRQLAVETSSHEYSNVHFDTKTFMANSPSALRISGASRQKERDSARDKGLWLDKKDWLKILLSFPRGGRSSGKRRHWVMEESSGPSGIRTNYIG